MNNITFTASDAARIPHRDDCPGGGRLDLAERQARPVVLCRACRRYALLGAAGRPRTPATPRPVAPAAVVAMSAWCCAEHLRPVTWKGNGCRECVDERRARQRDRDKAAQARREAVARKAAAR